MFIPYECSSNSNPLFLSSRHLSSSLSNHSIQLLRQLLNKPPGVGLLQFYICFTGTGSPNKHENIEKGNEEVKLT